MSARSQALALWAVYSRGLILMSSRAVRNLVSFILTPTLYAIAFGWGLGHDIGVDGVPYIQFILPGLAAMSGMNHSFGIATEINIARFQNHYFEEYLLSPARAEIIVLGEVLYGATRGLCSFAAVVLVSVAFSASPQSLAGALLPATLNALMFSAAGVWLALLVKSHRDMNFVTSFVITPMSFVAGTFFSLDRLPTAVRFVAGLLPLSPASMAIRAAWLGHKPSIQAYLMMGAYTLAMFLAARAQVRKAIP